MGRDKSLGGTAKRESFDAFLCCATHSACSFFPQPISGRTQSSLLTAKRRKLKIRKRSESLPAVVCVYVHRVRRPPSFSPKERERERKKGSRTGTTRPVFFSLFLTESGRHASNFFGVLRRYCSAGPALPAHLLGSHPTAQEGGEWRLVGNPLGLD